LSGSQIWCDSNAYERIGIVPKTLLVRKTNLGSDRGKKLLRNVADAADTPAAPRKGGRRGRLRLRFMTAMWEFAPEHEPWYLDDIPFEERTALREQETRERDAREKLNVEEYLKSAKEYGALTSVKRPPREHSQGGFNFQQETDAMPYADLFSIVCLPGIAQLLRAVEAALGRIREGNFGQCLSCGNEIGGARLEAVPWTPYCIQCQEDFER
jgi:Prokaryotic dksA/traR C4-type zinc finger